MQIPNCLIGVPKGLDYIFKILEAMNGDCHNPNLPYNLYLYNNLYLIRQGNQGTPKSQNVLELLHLSII